MEEATLVPVVPANKDALFAFDERVLHGVHSENPFLVSFVHDDHKIAQALKDPSQRQYFLLESNDGEVMARCGLKFNPPEDDICGYGANACARYHQFLGSMASLIGDLVDPRFRGQSLQEKMIQFRLGLLRTRGFRCAVAGIMEGNEYSRRNYIASGFASLGWKDITWDVEEPFTSPVELLGLEL